VSRNLENCRALAEVASFNTEEVSNPDKSHSEMYFKYATFDTNGNKKEVCTISMYSKLHVDQEGCTL
jgi:hypothetical protein